MKNPFFPLLIIGLLLSANLSVAMMNHMDEQGHSTCPFEMMQIANCTQFQNYLGFLVSHLNAVSRFFSVIPADGFSGSASLLLILALAVYVIFNKEPELFKLRPLFIKSKLHESFVPPDRIVFIRWLALHENSPAFI